MNIFVKFTAAVLVSVLAAGCDAPAITAPAASTSASAPQAAAAPVAAGSKEQAIVAADRFILAASKVGMADVLATYCPTYTLNEARRAAVEKQAVAAADAASARIGGLEVKRQINLRSVSQRKKYTSAYKRANQLPRYSGQDGFCRVADKEHAAQGFIGKLLIKS